MLCIMNSVLRCYSCVSSCQHDAGDQRAETVFHPLKLTLLSGFFLLSEVRQGFAMCPIKRE